ncbi:hypothetical protein DL95DRAFT_472189 [Leptodontidium sp. 2 PMI_412]|nr:hypothetical protein DL95DRAFT_472189 [Leptodontidium sp. 2 PMI_412]
MAGPANGEPDGPPSSSQWTALFTPQQNSPPPSEFRRITRGYKRRKNDTVTFTGANETPSFEFSGRGAQTSTKSRGEVLTPTRRERLLEIWPPTVEFRRLAEMAATVCRDQTVSAQDKPVTKLESTSQCEDLQEELGKSYKEMIEIGSSTAQVFDPQKSELHWIPETFVLTGIVAYVT